ncbi:hypothetical protein V5O48_007390 [Marasmius crinis-equi]|uniref:Uncharacterized protein n=1 Tax=Marasmius crinis-equi TaxID=585013 RepID=A0ABR3FH07_9AGAR
MNVDSLYLVLNTTSSLGDSPTSALLSPKSPKSPKFKPAMDPAQTSALRPNMRRKSSAQNLFSSFKSPTAATPATASSNPPPPPPPPSIPQTPTTANPMAIPGGGGREWDAQSLHSDSLPTPAAAQSTSDEYLRDLIQKRILTLTYIRNIHEGRSHWFHTIFISRADLDREFNNSDMKKRTHSFAVLGLSLSNLLDIHQPQDLLRALLSLLVEYDQAKPEDLDKNKLKPTRRIFGKGTKSSKQRPGLTSEYSNIDTSVSAADASYLMTPHLPFALDYHQTLVSLLDVLSEVYNKIAKLIGPSPLPHTNQQMMGPLGLLAPHPGVSYLFPEGGGGGVGSPPGLAALGLKGAGSPVPSTAQTAFIADLENSGLGAGDGASLYEIANGGPVHHHGHTHGNTGWSSNFGEMVLKIDSKFKKITSTLLKELDQFARTGIKEELASLDPLLRNIKMPDFDFEGM